MSQTVTFRGATYTIPSPGDSNDWGAALNAFLVAIAAGSPSSQATGTGTSSTAALALAPQTQPTGPNAVGNIYVTAAGLVYVCTVAGTPGTWVLLGPLTRLVGAGTSALSALALTPQSQPTGPNAVGNFYVSSAGVFYVCTAAGTPGTWAAVGAGSAGTTYTHTSPTDAEYTIATVAVPEGSIVQVKVTVLANVDQDGPGRGEPGGAFSGSCCFVGTYHNTSGTVQGLGTDVSLWQQGPPTSEWSAYLDILTNVLSVVVVNDSGTMLIDWTATVETTVLAPAA